MNLALSFTVTIESGGDTRVLDALLKATSKIKEAARKAVESTLPPEADQAIVKVS